jgi:hypothetical protein
MKPQESYTINGNRYVHGSKAYADAVGAVLGSLMYIAETTPSDQTWNIFQVIKKLEEWEKTAIERANKDLGLEGE